MEKWLLICLHLFKNSPCCCSDLPQFFFHKQEIYKKSNHSFLKEAKNKLRLKRHFIIFSFFRWLYFLLFFFSFKTCCRSYWILISSPFLLPSINNHAHTHAHWYKHTHITPQCLNDWNIKINSVTPVEKCQLWALSFPIIIIWPCERKDNYHFQCPWPRWANGPWYRHFVPWIIIFFPNSEEQEVLTHQWPLFHINYQTMEEKQHQTLPNAELLCSHYVFPRLTN